MVIAVFFFITAAFLTGFYTIVETPKGQIQLAPESLPNVREYREVVPASVLLHGGLVQQTYDYSCGSAALATVLKYQMGEDLTERQVIAGLLRYGDKEAIASRRAFSLLDMKHFVDRLGYKGVGYTAEVKDLQELGRPCIVPITVFNYRHFVVFKGIYRGHIFFADPRFGNTSYSLEEFQKIWFRNAIFVVYSKNGRSELSALQLKKEDLHFIDEDAANDILFTHDPEWGLTREWERDKTFPPEDTVQSKRFGSIRVIQQPDSSSETP
ncbi:MAG: peptidase C39 [Desulfobacteraceae bacterium]|nr:MAG: peptidase C39 [Desulfobacteraceae bacterium]